MSRFIDRTGEIIDDLTILSLKGFEKVSERNVSVWHCLCSCGKYCSKRSMDLTKTRGYKSCGCKRSSGNLRVGHKKFLGVGFNDLVGESSNDDMFYRKWTQMLTRCYETNHRGYKDYGGRGVTVCEEWLTFSRFKCWMEKQDWEGKELDKDLISLGNKLYSPETCIFVPPVVNTFLLKSGSTQTDTLIGASKRYIRGKVRYAARVQNPITKEREYLGIYKSELEAHKVWLSRKKEIALDLGDYLNEPYYGALLFNNLIKLYG